MGASTTLQQRHVAIVSSSSSAAGTPRSGSSNNNNHSATSISLPNGSGSSTTASPPQSSSRKRRVARKRPYRGSGMTAVRPLVWVGVMGMLATWWWLGWKVLLSSFSSSSSAVPVVFEFTSNNAPECPATMPHEQIDFTLVTQLSHDRLWMMRHHCQRYGRDHPISIAVYTNETLATVQHQLETDYDCDLQHLTVSIVDAHLYPASDDYPVNVLRNAALAHVQTSHLIYIDVDFWTSQDLYDTLSRSPHIRQALAEDSKLALVLPAFMLFRQCKAYKDCRKNNIPKMPLHKEDVLEMMVKKRGHIFDPTNRGGHGSTLYKDWIRQDVGSLKEISCLQSHRYEPFVIVQWCRHLPPFQNAFTGYGKNKLIWMMQMIRSGYKLAQVGGAFLVHYPHLDSAARTKWNESPEELVVKREKKHPEIVQIRRPQPKDGNLHLGTYKRGQVDRMFVQFREWLELNVADTSRLGMCDKAQDDDSKLWIDKEQDEENGGGAGSGETEKSQAKKVAIQKDNTRLEQEAAAVHGEDQMHQKAGNPQYLDQQNEEDDGEKGSSGEDDENEEEVVEDEDDDSSEEEEEAA